MTCVLLGRVVLSQDTHSMCASYLSKLYLDRPQPAVHTQKRFVMIAKYYVLAVGTLNVDELNVC